MMDGLRDFINELHSRIDYNDYSQLIDLADELIAENASLRKQLENAVVLPCKVGDTVYAIEHTLKPKNLIFECKVFNIKLEIINTGIRDYSLCCFNQFGATEYFTMEDLGEHWFRTRKHAEARLKELEEEK